MHTKYSPCSNIGEHAYGIFVYISIIQEESFFHPAKYPKKGGGAAKIIIEERRFLKNIYIILGGDVSSWDTDSKNDGDLLGVLALWK